MKKEITKKDEQYGVHMRHCFQGENKGNCKYGQDEVCPAGFKEGDLRVWHIPQVPMDKVFHISVEDLKQAKLVLNILAEYDIFQFENNVKPDYSNASGLEVFEGGEWCNWCDEDGNDIDDINEREIPRSGVNSKILKSLREIESMSRNSGDDCILAEVREVIDLLKK